jgi:Xaa-Pro aminopeptidase
MERTDGVAEEAKARRHRLEEQLEIHGIAAAVIANEQNFQYLTGYRTPSWALRGRPIFLVIRPGRSPAAVVNAGEEERIAELVPGLEALSYQRPKLVRSDDSAILDFAPAAVDQLRELLRPLGSRIGFELGSQMTPRIAVTALEELRRDLGVDLADITHLLWRIRLIKSRSEVELIRRSAAALTHTYESFEQQARPGMNERELHQLFLECAKRSQADGVGYLIVIAGTAGHVLGPPSSKPWMAGQLLLVDAGLTVDGYWSDFSRLYCAEEARTTQQEAYRAVVGALERGRSILRPGATAASISQAIQRAKGAGAEDSFGRVGHGIGLDLTEPPSFHQRDETVLQSGMTLCVEPNYLVEGLGLIVAEEMVSITDEGSELLSSSYPAELPVIAR